MEKTDKLKAIEKNETEKKNEMNDITKMPFINDLLDSLPNCLTIVDEDRHIYFANNKFLDFIGEDNIVNVLGVRIGNAFNCEIAVKYGECGKNLECAFCSSLASITEAVNTKKLDVRESSMTIIKNGHLESLDLKVYSTPTVIEGKKYIIFTFEDISH